jgi:hypothetical protein
MYDILETFFIKSVNTTNVNQDLELRIKEIEEELEKKLNEEERSLLLNYADAHFHLLNDCSTKNFKQGFWIGCRFMQELSEA